MKHIWFSLSGVRFHCYRQHLCFAYSLTSQTKDIEELWTHRTNENHTVFYRSLCDVDSYLPCYSLNISQKHKSIWRDINDGWPLACKCYSSKANVTGFNFYARLTAHSGLTGAIRNLAWRPRKTVFWNFVKVKSLTAGFIQHLIKEQAQIVVRTVEVQTVLDNNCTVFIFRVTAGSKRLWEQSAQILLHVYYVFHKQARRIVALNTTIR